MKKVVSFFKSKATWAFIIGFTLASMANGSPSSEVKSEPVVSTNLTAQNVLVSPEPTVEQAQGHHFEGSGKKVVDGFALNKGISKFKYSYKGKSNFIVKLYDTNGQAIELIANEIGSINGEKIAIIPTAGNYVLEIESSGTWAIDIEQ